MDSYVVQFHDAFGHREVRKVSRSLAGAQNHIYMALATTEASNIVWESDRTFCSAFARCRGPHAGFELISFSIERHEIID